MDFVINNDKIHEVKSTYKSSIQDLNRILIDLKNSIRYLDQNGIQGKAKEMFVDYLYADWETGFKQHIKDIEFLSELLGRAEAEALKLNDTSRSLTGIL